MCSDPSVCRREFVFRGRVQGVGFRYTARGVAERWQVCGYVRNTPDGHVELVVEGPTEKLDGFLAELRQAMRRNIRDVRRSERAPTGEFTGFDIRY